MELLADQTDTGQAALRTAKTARSTDTYVVTFSDDWTATFSGLVKSFTSTGGVDDVDKSSASIRITGTVVFAAGS
ncbi:MAG: hypothetical protein DRQ47_11275 [Gammaproteobacteria bacterium]|nr:MAG: hypothetical protein DRQ47_11275 [Gammaproteobacteria bacterium]